jgi:hypothetical protein
MDWSFEKLLQQRGAVPFSEQRSDKTKTRVVYCYYYYYESEIWNFLPNEHTKNLFRDRFIDET